MENLKKCNSKVSHNSMISEWCLKNMAEKYNQGCGLKKLCDLANMNAFRILNKIYMINFQLRNIYPTSFISSLCTLMIYKTLLLLICIYKK